MHRTLPLLFLVYFFLCSNLSSQILYSSLWEKHYLEFEKGLFTDALIEDTGMAILVGTDKGKEGKRAFLVKIDIEGTIRQTFYLSELIDPTCNRIVATVTGDYLIAGSAFEEGKQIGFIAKVDRFGGVIWSYKSENHEAIAFSNLVELESGKILALGDRKNDTVIFVFSKDGLVRVVRDLDTSFKRSKGLALLKVGPENIIIVAVDQGKFESLLLKYQLEPKWELVWKKSFPEQLIEAAKLTNDQKILLVGQSRQDNRQKGVLTCLQNLEVNRPKVLEKIEFYKDAAKDKIVAIHQAGDGNYYFVGYSYSHQIGSHRSQIWLQKIDANSREASTPEYIGNINRFSRGTNLLRWNSHELLIIGYDHLGNRLVPWAMKSKLPKLNLSPEVKIDSVIWAADVKIDGNLWTKYCRLVVKNTGRFNAPYIIPKINSASSTQVEISYSFSPEGFALAPGQKQTIEVEITGRVADFPSERSFDVELVSSKDQILYKGHYPIGNIPGTLVMIDHDDRLTFEQKGREIFCLFNLQNQSQMNLSGLYLQLQVEPNNGVHLLNNTIEIGEWSSLSYKTIEFQIELTEGFSVNSIDIDGYLYNRKGERIKTFDWEIELEKTQLMLEWSEASKEQDTTLQEKYRTLLFVQSSLPLTNSKWTVSLQRNGKLIANSGLKTKSDIVPISTSTSSAKFFEYHIPIEIDLDPGENEIVAKLIFKEKIEIVTHIIYYYRKPDLFVLSFGVPSNLRYTGKDAKDFAAAFVNQEGELYNKVHRIVINEADRTKADNIIDEMNRFREEYEDRITERDLLIIFFSSHGHTYEDKFLIQGSDFTSSDRVNNPKKTVDFEDEIIINIKDLPCKRLVFADACRVNTDLGPKRRIATTSIETEVPPYSEEVPLSKGKNDQRLEEAIFSLTKNKPELSFILSCSPGQASYESSKVENGLFTQAILDAFSGELISTDEGAKSADMNRDNVITLGELYEYISIRVPTMLTDHVDQNPFESIAQDSYDLPIFYLKT